MRVSKYPQRSEGWFRARLGMPTGSNAGKIISTNGKRSNQARKYLYQLAYERVCGVSGAEDLSAIPAVRDGLEREDAAADAFAEAMDVELDEIGFVTTDNGKFGCSPDRIIRGTKDVLEIKSPKPVTQIGYLLDGAQDAYLAQICSYFLVGFDAVHFWTYHPDCPGFYQKYPAHAYRPFTGLLANYLAEFCAELDEAERKLRAMDWTWSRVLSNWPEDEENEQ